MKLFPAFYNPFVCVALAFTTFSMAQAQTPSGIAKLSPISVDYTTLGGLRYSMGDVSLNGYAELTQVISPLNDYEASRLLKRSESSDLNGKIFSGVGLAGLLTGLVGVLTTSSNQRTPFWIAAAGGGICLDIGSLFKSEAQTAKFNCVQRYNRFARGEEQVLPKGPSDEKSLLNFSKDDPGPAAKPSVAK